MKTKILIFTLIALLSFITQGIPQEEPSKPEAAKKTADKNETPESMPGYDPYVFRKVGDQELRLHVIKPTGWKASDQRPCLVFFFGGGWSTGNPTGSKTWTHWASDRGMVGVAPDYRTFTRFKSTIEESVSDGRASVLWVQAHAAELGIDPAKIVAAGVSAGGHLAAWTAIPGKGPSSDDPGAPTPQPAALILLNPATDTKSTGSPASQKRFEGSAERALACSVTDKMPVKMPPTIVFHGTDDKAVPYANSVEFRDKMVANGNACELVTFQGLGHMYWMASSGAPGVEAKKTTDAAMEKFLTDLGLLVK